MQFFNDSTKRLLPNPPPGWSELKKKAAEATNARELSAIIDEMNRLLSRYEKGADNQDPSDELPARKADDQSTPGRLPSR